MTTTKQDTHQIIVTQRVVEKISSNEAHQLGQFTALLIGDVRCS